MTTRLNRSVALLVLLVLMAGAAVGCGRARPGNVTRLSSSTSPPTIPQPAHADLAHTDPAVWAAVEFERQHCSWNWQMTLAVYVGTQGAYATPEYGQQIAAQSDPASWQQEVVKEQQVVTCAVTNPVRVLNAPSTATQVYVRMTANSHITSTLGSFDAGAATASWVVQLEAGHWLVAGPFEGG